MSILGSRNLTNRTIGKQYSAVYEGPLNTNSFCDPPVAESPFPLRVSVKSCSYPSCESHSNAPMGSQHVTSQFIIKSWSNYAKLCKRPGDTDLFRYISSTFWHRFWELEIFAQKMHHRVSLDIHSNTADHYCCAFHNVSRAVRPNTTPCTKYSWHCRSLTSVTRNSHLEGDGETFSSCGHASSAVEAPQSSRSDMT